MHLSVNVKLKLNRCYFVLQLRPCQTEDHFGLSQGWCYLWSFTVYLKTITCPLILKRDGYLFGKLVLFLIGFLRVGVDFKAM